MQNLQRYLPPLLLLLLCYNSSLFAASGNDFVDGTHDGTLLGMLAALEKSGHVSLFEEITGYSTQRIRTLNKQGRVTIGPCGNMCANKRSTRIVPKGTKGPDIREYTAGTVNAWRDIDPNEKVVFVDGKPIAVLKCANPLVPKKCVACCPQVGRPTIIHEAGEFERVPFSRRTRRDGGRTSWVYPRTQPTPTE